MFTLRISLNLFNHVIKNTANQKLEICSLHLFYFFSVVFLFSVYSCLGCDGKVCLFKITIFFFSLLFPKVWREKNVGTPYVR